MLTIFSIFIQDVLLKHFPVTTCKYFCKCFCKCAMLVGCGYACFILRWHIERFLWTFYFMCSGRPLKKEITIAGFVGPFRMSHLPVGVIYLKGKSKWPNMFYNVHISIYNKWLEEKKKARILLFIFSEEWEMEKSLSLIQMKGVNQRIIVGATVAFLMLNVKISL